MLPLVEALEARVKMLEIAPEQFENFQLIVFNILVLDTQPMETVALAVMEDAQQSVQLVMCAAYYDALTDHGKSPHFSDVTTVHGFVRVTLDPVTNLVHVTFIKHEPVGSAGPIHD